MDADSAPTPNKELNVRGRSRDPDIDRVILAATLEHLARIGYSAMTLAGIARDAGVTKPTLYRRWSCKADLATAALMQIQAEEPPPTTGELRADLVALLENFRRSLSRPGGMAMIGMLLGEEPRMPELIQLFRVRITARRREMFSEVVGAALERGELPGDYDADAAINMLVGSLYARHIAGGEIPADWPRRVVVALLGD